MKMGKKMVLVLVCVLLSGFAMVSISNATPTNPGWYNVTVQSCGALPASNFYFVFATDSAGTPAWAGSRVFLIDATNPATKASLAAALTGYANSGNCALYMPGGTASGAFIDGVGAGSVQ